MISSTYLYFGLILFVKPEMSRETKARIVAIFIMDSELPYSMELAQPSVEIAIEKARQMYPLIQWDDPVFRNASNQCTSNNAVVIAAEEYHKKKVTAIIGPACGLALDPVARMASHWNIPILSSGGLYSIFSNKTVFSTLTRLSISLHEMGVFVKLVLKYFSWHHTVMITHETSQIIPLIKRSLQKSFEQSSNYNISLTIMEITRPLHKVNLTNLLIEASKEARVFIIVAVEEIVRKLLDTAYGLGMEKGDYVFIAIHMFKSMRTFGWIEKTHLQNKRTKIIYESLLLVAVRIPQSEAYESFVEEIAVRSVLQRGKFDEDDINVIITGFHDSVLLYAKALNETIEEKHDPTDGRYISRKLWNKTFLGYVSGDIHLNANGDKESDYTLSDFDPITMKMKTVFNFYGFRDENEALVKVGDISWPHGKRTAPLDVPLCGFTGDKCVETDNSLRYILVTALILIAMLIITAMVTLLIYRKLKLESELASHWWRIRWDEINIIEGSERSMDVREDSSPHASTALPQNYFLIPQKPAQTAQPNLLSVVEAANTLSKWRTETKKGIYKGMKVAVKSVNIRRLSVNRSVLLELKHMRENYHENLIRFIGLCPDEPHIFIITDYAQKGNLRDLLDNEAFRIDWPFRFSLLSDIIEGMCFIHNCAIEFHGRLKSTNCVIDRRLVVKLTDYGLRSLINQSVNDGDRDLKSLLWTAPEFLRMKNPHHHGSQKGDVYSFAIVLQEIVTRTSPFETPDNGDNSNPCPLNTASIVNRLKSGSRPYCRPNIPLSENECPPVVRELMIDCWSEDPASRPTFESIRNTLKKATRDQGTGNFLENLLLRMEQYANDLEKLVENKTAAFFEEKRKCEEILYEVLPRYVVEQLKFGNNVRPESFECVTIFFSDIVGFAELSSNSNPMQIVELLNDVYSVFDAVIGNHDVYKVETVGDAYMVVSGLPINNGNEHVREICRMSLELLQEIKKFKIKHMPDTSLQLRIGIHSGPCAAGVIGLKMPRYCLFGDTINTASRMETHGEPMKIHISCDTKRLLQTFGTFEVQRRGVISIKGKGNVETYWLLKENDSL